MATEAKDEDVSIRAIIQVVGPSGLWWKVSAIAGFTVRQSTAPRPSHASRTTSYIVIYRFVPNQCQSICLSSAVLHQNWRKKYTKNLNLIITQISPSNHNLDSSCFLNFSLKNIYSYCFLHVS